MKRICTICARGGSKGVPGKNIKLLGGVPLIAHSIKIALESKMFDCIAVSSDSQDILNVAKEYGANALIERPAEMASDSAGKIPAIRHCWQEAEVVMKDTFDYLLDLDVTSPLRSVEDIQESIKVFESENAPNLITGCPARRSPFFNMVKLADGKYASLVNSGEKMILRRQDAPQCFDMNASIYIWSREALFHSDQLFYPNTLFYEMPEERSVDIDTELDFKIVSILLEENK